MADGTKIEWCEATWQPITGCSVVSAGCKHCYAMKLAGTRLQHHPSRAGLTVDTAAGPVWNGQVRFNPEWLDQPLRWKRPRRIFVCAHGDLFHESVPDDWIDRVFAVMALAPQHVFQVLTKRPERMREYLDDRFDNREDAIGSALREITDGHHSGLIELPLPNVWLGVSVEHQEAANERIPLLLQTPAAVRWISAEPLLGPIDLARMFVVPHNAPVNVLDDGTRRSGYRRCVHHTEGYCFGDCSGRWPALDWVVCGGESGAGARPMHPNWARSLRDQCTAAGVAFYFKQWGAWLDGDSDEATQFVLDPDGRGVHEWPDDHVSIHVGKKSAGRLLDGVLHDGYPEPA